MRRREFLDLGGAAAALPLAAVAQQTGKIIPRVGFFGASLSSAPQIAYYKAFLDLCVPKTSSALIS